ncbi:unnamed protein product [Malus baccata var. baccata]
MSKFRHETKDFNTEFHRWYNMEPFPLPGSPKANPTSSFSSVDLETPLENINQILYETGFLESSNEKLMKAKKELVDLNGKANEALYHANKQKMKADMCVERLKWRRNTRRGTTSTTIGFYDSEER